MQQHVKILGILHIVFGSLGVLAGLIVLAVFGGLAGVVGVSSHGDHDAAVAMPILLIIGVGVMILILVLSIPGIIAGIGLLNFRPWARILTIVLSALDLFSVPIGTAVGVYGLWVLLSNETLPLFEHPRA